MSNQQDKRGKTPVTGKLILLNVIVLLSGLIGIFGAIQINQGAQLHELNILHLSDITEFISGIDSFENEKLNDLNVLTNQIKAIRKQPENCLESLGWFDKAVMKLAGTYQTIEVCKNDLKIADDALEAVVNYRNKMISREAFDKEMNRALLGFQKSSKDFQPLVANTVGVIFFITIFIFSLKAVILIIGGFFISKSVADDYIQLKNTTYEKKRAEEVNIDLRRLSEELAESEKKYHDYYENTPDLQASVDANTACIIECNETMGKALGYSKSEIIGKKVFDFYHPDSLEVARACFKKFVKTGAVHNEELQLQRKDGDRIDVLLNVTSYIGEDGKSKYSRSVWVDISGRKKAEELLQKAKDESEKANVKLKELDRLKSMFIASMSHELRTPLNSIIGFSGIMLQGVYGELNERHKDYTERVNKAGVHLLQLISDVIDISKIEAGRIDVSTTSFFLDEMVDEAIELIRPQAEKKGLTLLVHIPQGLEMKTDRRRLFQCLLNYISNAIKYSEKGGATITAEKRNDQIFLEVSDTGIGIYEAGQSKIFGAFDRLESHLQIKAGGTGLGLYLTHKIVKEALQGSIGFESKEGEGSRFWLEVPQTLNPDES